MGTAIRPYSDDVYDDTADDFSTEDAIEQDANAAADAVVEGRQPIVADATGACTSILAYKRVRDLKPGDPPKPQWTTVGVYLFSLYSFVKAVIPLEPQSQ